MEQIAENEWVQPQKEGYEFRINNSKVVLMDFRIHCDLQYPFLHVQFRVNRIIVRKK